MTTTRMYLIATNATPRPRWRRHLRRLLGSRMSMLLSVSCSRLSLMECGAPRCTIIRPAADRASLRYVGSIFIPNPAPATDIVPSDCRSVHGFACTAPLRPYMSKSALGVMLPGLMALSISPPTCRHAATSSAQNLPIRDHGWHRHGGGSGKRLCSRARAILRYRAGMRTTTSHP